MTLQEPDEYELPPSDGDREAADPNATEESSEDEGPRGWQPQPRKAARGALTVNLLESEEEEDGEEEEEGEGECPSHAGTCQSRKREELTAEKRPCIGKIMPYTLLIRPPCTLKGFDWIV